MLWDLKESDMTEQLTHFHISFSPLHYMFVKCFLRVSYFLNKTFLLKRKKTIKCEKNLLCRNKCNVEIKTYPDEDSELTEQRSHHHHMCLAEIQGLSGEWGNLMVKQ